LKELARIVDLAGFRGTIRNRRGNGFAARSCGDACDETAPRGFRSIWRIDAIPRFLAV